MYQIDLSIIQKRKPNTTISNRAYLVRKYIGVYTSKWLLFVIICGNVDKLMKNKCNFEGRANVNF